MTGVSGIYRPELSGSPSFHLQINRWPYVKWPLYTVEYFKSDFHVWNAPDITYTRISPASLKFLLCLNLLGKHRKLSFLMCSCFSARNSPQANSECRETGLYCAKVVCKLLGIIWGPTGSSQSIAGFTALRISRAAGSLTLTCY